MMSKVLKKRAILLRRLNGKRVEVLPYHTLGLFKWEKLGIDYSLKDARVPTKEEVKKAEQLLRVGDYNG